MVGEWSKSEWLGPVEGLYPLRLPQDCRMQDSKTEDLTRPGLAGPANLAAYVERLKVRNAKTRPLFYRFHTLSFQLILAEVS